MARLILRYRGDGPIPAGDLARIKALPGLEIVDETARMLLVEAVAEELEALIVELPEWVFTPDFSLALPEPRPEPPAQ